MFSLQKTVERLCRELEAERVENARFRRLMEDILYNLEEENMPAVSARLQKGEKSIGLLVEDGAVRGSVLVEAINDTSSVTIGADKIDLDGKLVVDSINNASSVTIDADKIDLDGRLVVDSINNTSSVTIDADKIDLNGAVTANENFKIHEDGSVSCRALTLTGGEICLPDPGDGTAVLRVETEREGGGVTVFADRIAFDGSFTAGWAQEADMSLEQLRLANEVDNTVGGTTRAAIYCRPGQVRVTRQETSGGVAGKEDEAVYDARGVSLPYLASHPKSKQSGMRPLYIDANGNLCAVYDT